MEDVVRTPVREEGKRAWPLLLLFLAVFLFFQSMILLKRVPWFSDIKTYYLPNWTYLSHALRTGGLSFWCPGIYCGFPLFADSEMGLFYPFNPLFFLLPSLTGFTWSLVFHYLLGGGFLYLYCRRLGLSRPASLFAALPFMLGGFLLAHLVHPNAVATAAWMPLFLYLLERALGEARFSFFLLTGGVLGLQFLGGFLMVPLMEGVMALFYVIFHHRGRREGGRGLLADLGGLAAAFALGAGLGMAQNLPSYFLVRNSYRAGGLSGSLANTGNLPALQLLGLVLPRSFGRGIAQGGYLGAWTFEETYGYVGILPLLFAPAALRRERAWPAAFFFWTAVVSLLLSLGNQGLLWPLLHRLPGFHVLKGPSRFLLTCNLSVLLLGAMGLDRWRQGRLDGEARSRLVRGWALAAGIVTACLALLTVLYRCNLLGFRDFAALVARPLLTGVKAPTERVLSSLCDYFTTWRTEFLVPLALLGIFFLLLSDTRRKGGPRRVTVCVAVLVAFLDTFVFASLVLKPVPRNRAESRPAVINVLEDLEGGRAALLKEPGINRGEFALSSNQLLPYSIPDAFGFSTIPPARLDRFLGYLDRQPDRNAFALLGVEALYADLVRVRGVPYDFGFPFSIAGGLGSSSYACDASLTGKELRFLLDGRILERDAHGKLYLKLDCLSGGRVVRLPVLLLEKEAGEEECALTVMYNEYPPTIDRIGFRSPGYGRGREAVEVRVPCRLRRSEQLVVTTACQESLEGTRLLAVSMLDEYGRGFPLTPWPAAYSDGRHAVYTLEESLYPAFPAWEFTWAEDWREAVDIAWEDGFREGNAVLLAQEIDPALRERISSLRAPQGEVRVDRVEEGGDHLSFRTTSGGDCVLVLSLDYLPGWEARVDGRPCGLFSAYGFLTALYLPAGEHLVTLDYRQPGLAVGAAVSILSLFAFLALLLLVGLRERARARGQAREAPSLPPPQATSISAFFPCYNDSATIGEVVTGALEVLRELCDDYEVIIVDDGSSDASGAVIDSLAAAYPEVRVVRHDRNRGYGAALRSGIKTSAKQWVFYTDSDGQYDVADLRRLHALSGTADVVNGYKESRSDPWYRVLLGKAYNFFVRRLFLVPIRDVDCDFRLMRGDLARSLDLRSEGGSICVELVKGLQARGARFAETPVRHLPRREGRSQFFRLKNLLAMVAGLASLWWRLARKGGL
ncbi:MAG: glycosyltransferase [Actinobacteria bacterium]|nr:glycosyltransferase [Actinomycetota bacterium]